MLCYWNIVKFRDTIRKLALSDNPKTQILVECDNLRNELLQKLNIRIEDRGKIYKILNRLRNQSIINLGTRHKY